MAHDGTGTGWDIASPADTEPRRDGAKEIRDLRKGVAIRSNKEHVTDAAASAGGEHLAGSAKAYYAVGASAPTKRPDGTTNLASADAGRLFILSDTQQIDYWNGTSWSGILIYTAQLADANVTVGKIANNTFTADATGRGKFANGFVNTALLADAALTADATGRAKMADGFVSTAKLATSVLTADATGRGKMADGFVTLAKLASEVPTARVYQGNYAGAAGSGDVNPVPLGYGFQADFILIIGSNGASPIPHVFFRSETVGDVNATAYALGQSGTKVVNAIDFTSTGFLIHAGNSNVNTAINANAITYYFIAIKNS